MSKLVRLVALDFYDNELGAVDGEELTIVTTDDGEIQVTNGRSGIDGPIVYDWADLAPDYQRGGYVRLELEIIDED